MTCEPNIYIHENCSSGWEKLSQISLFEKGNMDFPSIYVDKIATTHKIVYSLDFVGTSVLHRVKLHVWVTHLILLLPYKFRFEALHLSESRCQCQTPVIYETCHKWIYNMNFVAYINYSELERDKRMCKKTKKKMFSFITPLRTYSM